MIAPEHKRTTFEDLLAAVRAYVKDNLPGDRPLSIDVPLASGGRICHPVPPDPEAPGPCTHSDDFRQVNWFGTAYAFSAAQGAVVALLWSAWADGGKEIAGGTLRKAADSDSERVRDLFRHNGEVHAAWGTMIVPGAGKGTYRLIEPDDLG